MCGSNFNRRRGVAFSKKYFIYLLHVEIIRVGVLSYSSFFPLYFSMVFLLLIISLLKLCERLKVCLPLQYNNINNLPKIHIWHKWNKVRRLAGVYIIIRMKMIGTTNANN